LSAVQDLINQSGSYNGIKSNVHFFSGNWEERADEDIIVEADKGRIIQVISNILSNAIRFAKQGDINISIKRKGEIIGSDDGKCNNDNGDNNNKGEVIVSVKDNGQGIDPDILPRLFSKFAVTSNIGGTGLGLFISKNIIEAHGGRIWAENNANGKGATFSFTLPIDN
jgi:signal transduction histidine kinase